MLVAAHHLHERLQEESFNAFYSVDLFFVLSGFVMALNYGGRFQTGLTTWRFVEMRLIRLYPLYLVGLVIGTIKQLLGHVVRDPRVMGGGELACNVAFGALFVPSVCSPLLFPLNVPTWSAFFEIVINIVFALFLWRARSRVLIVLMAAAVLLLLTTLDPPFFLNEGWSWWRIAQGAARTVFSFSSGMLIYRHLSVQDRRSWLCLLPVAAVAAIMLVPVPAAVAPLAQAVTILLVIPAIIVLAVKLEAPRALFGLFGALGDISYPLYAIHWPLIAIALPLIARAHVPHALAAAVFVVALLPVAYGATLVDARVRRWISRALHVRRSAALQVL